MFGKIAILSLFVLVACQNHNEDSIPVDVSEFTVAAQVQFLSVTCSAYTMARRAMPYSCWAQVMVPPEAVDVDCDSPLNGCSTGTGACNFYVMRKVRMGDIKVLTVLGREPLCPSVDLKTGQELKREITYTVQFAPLVDGETRQYVTKVYGEVSKIEAGQFWEINIGTNQPIKQVAVAK